MEWLTIAGTAFGVILVIMIIHLIMRNIDDAKLWRWPLVISGVVFTVILAIHLT